MVTTLLILTVPAGMYTLATAVADFLERREFARQVRKDERDNLCGK